MVRTEVPGLRSPFNLSIVEIEIHSGNIEHSDANGVELHPAGKCNLLNLHSRKKPVLQHSKKYYSSNCIFVKKKKGS